MKRIRTATMLAVSTMLLPACGQMYWSRENASATLERFTRDHRECLIETGAPVQDRPGYVIATEEKFRVCMLARNWHREAWSSWEAPRGRFRGLEDFPPRPISVDALPEQTQRAKLDVNEPGYIIPGERCIECPVP